MFLVMALLTLPALRRGKRAPWPLAREVMAVTSSGREVPRATKVRAITDSGTPRAWAMRVPLSTSRLAPTAPVGPRGDRLRQRHRLRHLQYLPHRRHHGGHPSRQGGPQVPAMRAAPAASRTASFKVEPSSWTGSPPALRRGKLSRVQGLVLLAVYAAFCAAQFTL